MHVTLCIDERGNGERRDHVAQHLPWHDWSLDLRRETDEADVAARENAHVVRMRDEWLEHEIAQSVRARRLGRTLLFGAFADDEKQHVLEIAHSRSRFYQEMNAL